MLKAPRETRVLKVTKVQKVPREILVLPATRAAKESLETKVRRDVMAIRVPRARKVTLVHRVQLGLPDPKEQRGILEHRDPLVLKVQPALRDKKVTKVRKVKRAVRALEAP